MLHLHNGNPATLVKLERGHTVYGDVDMDGSLDQVDMEFTNDRCLAYVSSVYPHQRALFVEPLCEDATWWGSMSFLSHLPITEDIAVDVSPVIVKRYFSKSIYINKMHCCIGINIGLLISLNRTFVFVTLE